MARLELRARGRQQNSYIATVAVAVAAVVVAKPLLLSSLRSTTTFCHRVELWSRYVGCHVVRGCMSSLDDEKAAIVRRYIRDKPQCNVPYSKRSLYTNCPRCTSTSIQGYSLVWCRSRTAVLYPQSHGKSREKSP
jgi:hypothetical protein